MKTIQFRKLITLLFILNTLLIYSQKNDTIFYGKNKIRSIEFGKSNEKKVIKFFSTQGEDLLAQGSFKYSYFDSIMGRVKEVLVENKSINQEYWISENDTIYDKAKFDPIIDKQVNKFLNYVNNNLVYPKDALDRNIKGKIYVSFIVNKKGEITQIKPITTIGYGFEESVIQTVSKYKNWGFVTINKKVVNCFFRLPITFVL